MKFSESGLAVDDFLTKCEARIQYEANSGCWLWCGSATSRQGYASLTVGAKKIMVHRALWEIHTGTEIPDGMEMCHRCDTPPCVNPSHMFVGTRRDNLLDCLNKGRHVYAAQTTCKHGHPLSGDNVRVEVRRNGMTTRRCKECTAINLRRMRERRREAGFSSRWKPLSGSNRKAHSPFFFLEHHHAE